MNYDVARRYGKRIWTELIGDVMVVHLACRILDEQNTKIVGDQLLSLVNDDGWRNFVVSLARVESFMATAIGTFLSFKKVLDRVGGKFIFCDVSPDACELVRLTNSIQVFTIAKDCATALSLF